MKRSRNRVFTHCLRYLVGAELHCRTGIETHRAKGLPYIGVLRFRQSRSVHADTPQHARGTNSALPRFSGDTDMPVLLPARARISPGRVFTAALNVLRERFRLGLPKAR